MSKRLDDLDLNQFWRDSDYARETYVGPPLIEAVVGAVEGELGYKLPQAYVQFMKRQNGGMPKKTNHRTSERTSWAKDHVAITGLYSIGREKRCSLRGESGSQFWIEMWDYPAIGVYFADCPSAGHDMICFDYRSCGSSGEPAVVHVDQEWDYKITAVAPDFEAFILGLEGDEAFT